MFPHHYQGTYFNQYLYPPILFNPQHYFSSQEFQQNPDFSAFQEIVDHQSNRSQPAIQNTQQVRVAQQIERQVEEESYQVGRVKRKYRKRRSELQKKFRCTVRECKRKYSSKIALNAHKRKKHDSRQQRA